MPLLLAAFIFIPILELYFFMTVGRVLGIGWTLLIILITAVIGAKLAKREGLGVLARMREAQSQGRLPHKEVTEGVLILFAGALLLTPGFLTDAFGFTLLFPPTRAFYREKLAGYLKSKITFIKPGGMPSAPPAEPRVEVPATEKSRKPRSGEIIDVEVIDDPAGPTR